MRLRREPASHRDVTDGSRGIAKEIATPFGAHVVVGKKLVTGQNPASTKGVAEAVVKMLEG